MRLLSSDSSQRVLGWIVLTFAWLATLVFVVHAPVIGDEAVHWRQIERFLHGDYRVLDDWLTNVPGYHWLVALLLWACGLDGLAWVRALGGLFLLACLLVMFHTRQAIHSGDAQRTVAQLLFFPVLLIYAWLAYTDVPALAFLLGAMLATIHDRHGLSAMLLLASMAMRQNQVFWAAFLALYAAWPVLANGGWRVWRQWRALWAINWPYAACVMVFLGYWLWNGSISYSTAQAQAHPDLVWRIGNPMFLLVVAAMLFPLQMIAGWRRCFACVRSSGYGWIWLLLPLAVFVLYAWQFQVDHPYNRPMGVSLRNKWLNVVSQETWAWWAFGLSAAWASVGLAFARYAMPQGWLWLPFSLAFVGASWMIETRYVIVPLVLFLALRVPESNWIERATLGGWVLFSGWLMWNVFNLNFML